MFLLLPKAYAHVKISVSLFFFCLWLLFCVRISFSIWCRNNYFWLVVSISFCLSLLKICNVISRILFHRARRGNISLFSSVPLYHACSDSCVCLTQFNLHLICSTSISAFIRRGAFISVHRIAFIFLDCILFNSLFNPIFNSLFNFITRILFRIRIDIPFAFGPPTAWISSFCLIWIFVMFTSVLVLLLGRHAGVSLILFSIAFLWGRRLYFCFPSGSLGSGTQIRGAGCWDQHY